MKKRVLILGAGYGGIFAAAHLCKENEHYSISLIDKNPYLQLVQQIPYIISDSKRQKDITVKISELFANQMHTGHLEFIQAVVEGINLENQTVRVSAHRKERGIKEYQYDYLIVSLGSDTQYFNITGAKENSLPFRSVQDALEIKEKLSALPENSTIIVGGGGPTGVSLAAALSESQLVNGKNIQIKIIEASDNLLPGWDPRLSKASQKILSSKGIKILTGRTIKKITSRSAITDLGEEIISGCTIWTAGYF